MHPPRLSRAVRATALAFMGLGCLVSQALAGSPHEAAAPRPFSQPEPLAQELRHRMESPWYASCRCACATPSTWRCTTWTTATA